MPEVIVGSIVVILGTVIAIFKNKKKLSITDNGDGTWTATSKDPSVITMIGKTEFSIDADSARYLSDNTYRISSSPHPKERA